MVCWAENSAFLIEEGMKRFFATAVVIILGIELSLSDTRCTLHHYFFVAISIPIQVASDIFLLANLAAVFLLVVE